MLNDEGISLQFSTVNSLGNRVLYKTFGRKKVDRNLTQTLLCEVLEVRDERELKQKYPQMVDKVSRIVELVKLTMLGWNETQGFDENRIGDDDIRKLCEIYDVDPLTYTECNYVREVLSMSTEVDDNPAIDFNDQNWLPIVLGLSIYKSDMLLVDEGQDLPRCKQEFVLRAGKRIMIVGDDNQAIYGFAGADVESLYRMHDLLGLTGEKPFMLTETRRCSQAVVAEARKLVPDFKAHESNSEGSVQSITSQRLLAVIEDGDMVVSRVNAPLIRQAMSLLKEGKKVVVRGRNFGRGLVKFVKMMKADSVPDLIEKVMLWSARETKTELTKPQPNEGRLLAITDKAICIENFCQDAESVDHVIERIEKIFSGKICPVCNKFFDDELERCPACKTETLPGQKWKVGPKLMTPNGVLLSSVHRAKGLEANNVFVLLKNAPMPHPMAKQKWEIEQERNLKYVAITRAIENLYWVY